MKITLLSDERLRLDDSPGPLTIEAESADMTYSPFHMVASGLATCTLAVLHSWASHAGIATDGLAVEIGWQFAEKPHRVANYDVVLHWPKLADERAPAASRAAALCAVHNTLAHPPSITVEVEE
ncbi:MAG TPA: OsmC family protein [Gemmatimonadaceae bacterium]|nr:OsmC family protein [Gemmatimonadaceae bacterium]